MNSTRKDKPIVTLCSLAVAVFPLSPVCPKYTDQSHDLTTVEPDFNVKCPRSKEELGQVGKKPKGNYTCPICDELIKEPTKHKKEER